MSTPNLAIPHILQSQAQKEVTANAAFDALDQAIAGLLEVDLSAGGTITVDAPGALKSKMLRLTGTLADGAEVVVPDNRKPYFVHNATAGGFAVTVRTAAGLGVSVGSSPDNTAVVYCDGTDVLAISSIVAGPYDPAMFIPGTHASGALIAQVVFPRTVTFPAGFAGSQAYAQVPAPRARRSMSRRTARASAASRSVLRRAPPASPWRPIPLSRPVTAWRSSTRTRPTQPSPICPSP